MLCRALAVSLIMILVSSLSQAAEPYASISKRLDEKYEDEACSKEATKAFNRTSRLSCVSCAVEKFAGFRPSTKYLALLAVHAQKTVGLGVSENSTGTRIEHAHSSQGGTANEALLKRVIQEVQAYGACAANVGGYGDIPSTEIMDLVHRAISGSTSKRIPVVKNGTVIGSENSVGYSSEERDQLVKFFGFRKFEDMDYLLGDDGFSGSSPQERQRAFAERARNVSYNPSNGDGLKECLKQISNKRSEPAFNTANVSTNMDLCYFTAMECEQNLSLCDNTAVRVVPASGRPPPVPIREVESSSRAR